MAQKQNSMKVLGYPTANSLVTASSVVTHRQCLNGYTKESNLMFNRLLGKVVSPDKIHPRMWVGANRKFGKVSRRDVEVKKQNKVKCSFSSYVHIYT